MHESPLISFQEKQTQFDNATKSFVIKTILTNKNQLPDRNQKCIGVIGSYFDISGKTIISAPKRDNQNSKLFLGKEFFNQHLTKKEYLIFKLIIHGQTALQIANNLSISTRTVETHTEKLKLKLQCKTKGDIIVAAIKLGITTIVD